jgi:septum formation protein
VILNQLLQGKKVVLASQSPRRHQLLGELGVEFEVRLNGETDESYPDTLKYSDIPIYLAQKKAEPFRKNLASNELLITSDTIVWCNGRVIGKPTDRNDAVAILKELSGVKHVVITGVTLLYKDKIHSFSASTDVYFRELTDEEINYYVDKFKPFDKAGAYGVQEWIGYVGVERIDGSYFNVMGLPVQKLYSELIKFLEE